MLPGDELSSKAHIAGFAFHVKTPGDFMEDWEQGGMALNDPSEGLEVQLWHLQAKYNETTGNVDCIVEAPSVAPTVLFSGVDISEVALAFDQNMNPFVAYIQAGVPKIYWYDPIIPGMTHTTLPAGCYDLRCTLDDHRDFATGDSDIVLGYINAGNLCVRYQSDRYLIEHVLKVGVGGSANLVSMAMNRQWRLQFRLRNYELTDDPQALIVSEPYLGDIVHDLCIQAGIKPQNINVADLYQETDIVPGLLVNVDDGLDKPIDWLMEIFQFTKSQYNKKLNFEHKGKDITFRIPYDHLVVTGTEQALKREQVKEKELPRKVNVNHIDSTGGFARNKQSATRRSNLITTDEQLNIESKVVLTPDQGATAALTIIKARWGEQYEYEFSTTIRYTEVTPGDVGEVQDAKGVWHRVRIRDKNEDDKVIEWDAVQDAGDLTYGASGAPGSFLDPPVSTTPGLVGDTQLEILNLPVQRDQDDELGLYLAARGASSGWSGYTLYLSIDGGATYAEMYTSTALANIGETVTDITNIGTSVEVLMPYPIASVTPSQIAAGYNRFVLGDEEVQVQTATLIGMVGAQYHYNLTGLVRGVLRTTKEPWSAGVRFVAIDEAVLFVQMQREFYGLDLYYKAVSFGQSVDDVAPLAYLFDYAASQTEWAGTDVEVVAAPGGGVTVTWVGAPRLGTFGPNPYHSKYMIGYRVKFSDGHTIDTTEQTVTYANGLLGTPVEVRALNAITGEGPVFGGEGEVDPGDTPVFGFSGSFPDLYEGEPVFLRVGDNGIDMAGGYWDANARGFVVPGVGAKCSGSQLSDTVFVGIPFAAGTYTSMVRVDASSPEPGGSGTADINQTVEVLARPTHGLLDLRLRDVTPRAYLLPSTPPWKKWEMKGGSLHFYGVTTGKVVGQVIIDGAAPLSVALGINGERGAPAFGQSPIGINLFAASTFLVGDGTYSIELDADTGDFWIYELVGGVATLIHSGNQPLTPGCLYHIGISNTAIQTITAEFNGGNETWFMPVTQAGHGGIPVPVHDVPLAWAYVEPDYALSFNGNQFAGATYADDFAGGPSNVAKSNAVYSSGRWRWKVSGTSYGICVAAFDETHGLLGSSGSPNSAGMYGTTLSWSWGGGGSVVLEPLNLTYQTPIMGLDADGDTLAIYYQDYYGEPQLVYILPLPAGQSWHVAARAGVNAVIEPVTGPPGYSDAVVP